MKNKKTLNKFLKISLIAWGLLIFYEFLFMNTKYGLSNYIDENSPLYTVVILTPMIGFIAFLAAFVVASHYKEITDTWKNNPDKIIDELKLIALGILFFAFLCLMYLIFHK